MTAALTPTPAVALDSTPSEWSREAVAQVAGRKAKRKYCSRACYDKARSGREAS